MQNKVMKQHFCRLRTLSRTSRWVSVFTRERVPSGRAKRTKHCGLSRSPIALPLWSSTCSGAFTVLRGVTALTPGSGTLAVLNWIQRVFFICWIRPFPSLAHHGDTVSPVNPWIFFIWIISCRTFSLLFSYANAVAFHDNWSPTDTQMKWCSIKFLAKRIIISKTKIT